MGRNAKLREQRQKSRYLNRDFLSRVTYWLNDPETEDWIIRQWKGLINFYLFGDLKATRILIRQMLDCLDEQIQLSQQEDVTAMYDENPYVTMKIGINTLDWTLWTSIRDKQTNFLVQSLKSEDLKLDRLIPL